MQKTKIGCAYIMTFPINPFVRYIAKTTYYINDLVTARDCRLLYILEGCGTFESQGNRYPLVPHTLLYYPYGIPYRITTETEKKSMLFFTVNFDFTQEYSHITGPLVPYTGNHVPPSMLTSLDNIQSYGGAELFSCICHLPNALWAEHSLQQIYNEEVHKNLCSTQLRNAYMSILLLELYRSVYTPAPENPICVRAKELIAQNLCYTNDTLAELLNYHPYYLNSLFKQDTGITLHKYIQQQRLARAYEMLATTQLSIEDIALRCGFCSQSHLSNLFKEAYHITPARLRRQV